MARPSGRAIFVFVVFAVLLVSMFGIAMFAVSATQRRLRELKRRAAGGSVMFADADGNPLSEYFSGLSKREEEAQAKLQKEKDEQQKQQDADLELPSPPPPGVPGAPPKSPGTTDSSTTTKQRPKFPVPPAAPDAGLLDISANFADLPKLLPSSAAPGARVLRAYARLRQIAGRWSAVDQKFTGTQLATLPATDVLCDPEWWKRQQQQDGGALAGGLPPHRARCYKEKHRGEKLDDDKSLRLDMAHAYPCMAPFEPTPSVYAPVQPVRTIFKKIPKDRVLHESRDYGEGTMFCHQAWYHENVAFHFKFHGFHAMTYVGIDGGFTWSGGVQFGREKKYMNSAKAPETILPMVGTDPHFNVLLWHHDRTQFDGWLGWHNDLRRTFVRATPNATDIFDKVPGVDNVEKAREIFNRFWDRNPNAAAESPQQRQQSQQQQNNDAGRFLFNSDSDIKTLLGDDTPARMLPVDPEHTAFIMTTEIQGLMPGVVLAEILSGMARIFTAGVDTLGPRRLTIVTHDPAFAVHMGVGNLWENMLRHMPFRVLYVQRFKNGISVDPDVELDNMTAFSPKIVGADAAEANAQAELRKMRLEENKGPFFARRVAYAPRNYADVTDPCTFEMLRDYVMPAIVARVRFALRNGRPAGSDDYLEKQKQQQQKKQQQSTPIPTAPPRIRNSSSSSFNSTNATVTAPPGKVYQQPSGKLSKEQNRQRFRQAMRKNFKYLYPNEYVQIAPGFLQRDPVPPEQERPWWRNGPASAEVDDSPDIDSLLRNPPRKIIFLKTIAQANTPERVYKCSPKFFALLKSLGFVLVKDTLPFDLRIYLLNNPDLEVAVWLWGGMSNALMNAYASAQRRGGKSPEKRLNVIMLHHPGYVQELGWYLWGPRTIHTTLNGSGMPTTKADKMDRYKEGEKIRIQRTYKQDGLTVEIGPPGREQAPGGAAESESVRWAEMAFSMPDTWMKTVRTGSLDSITEKHLMISDEEKAQEWGPLCYERKVLKDGKVRETEQERRKRQLGNKYTFRPDMS